MPEAVTAFLEGTDFEDVIRTAVSLGGDCDTLTCIAGGIAEAFYGVPIVLEAECRVRLPEDMQEVLKRFDEARGRTKGNPDEFLVGNSIIEDAIEKLHAEQSAEKFEKGESASTISHFIDVILKGCRDMEEAGIIINPWDKPFFLTTELICMILDADKPDNHIYLEVGA